MERVIVHLPPDYPEDDHNYPSKMVLEQYYTALLPFAKRYLLMELEKKKKE